MLKDLAEYFHIYLIDLLGMGSSGRPRYTADSVDAAEDFFVDGLRISEAEVKQHLAKGTFLLADDDDKIDGCVYVELRGERWPRVKWLR